MSKTNWNTQNIPNQEGKVVIITGASSGLGRETARILISKGATIIMAVRNIEKGKKVLSEIVQGNATHNAQVMKLDLGSLNSIKKFAINFNNRYQQLDVLINNAGIMMCPFARTEDGFEIQMGTNHLGHFALTGRLMDVLRKTPNSRVIATSSLGHKQTKGINFNDFNWETRKYNTNQAYYVSKLANLYFAYEFAERFKNDVDAPKITVAHPGWTSTNLQQHSGMMRFLNPIFSQKPEMGVLPTLRASFDNSAKAGDFFGPAGWQEFKGYPELTKSSKVSYEREPAKKLWEISEKLTNIKY